MRHAFVRVDDKKQGKITRDNFFKILEILDVVLSKEDKQKCIFNHEVNGFIKYNDTMRFLAINKKEENWVFKTAEQL
jgi:Ca2+-binding EF-hand superfamily protein